MFNNTILWSILVLTILSSGLLTNVSILNAESWDGTKSSNEAANWRKQLETWNSRIENWSEKREELREQIYGDKLDNFNDPKYCTTEGCWEERMFELTFTSSTTKLELSKNDSDLFIETFDGLSAESVNGGQVVDYQIEGEKFSSSNFGQTISFTNIKGDTWDSSNFGQSLTYLGNDGSTWNSSNFGQVLSGKNWERGNFGQSFTQDDELIISNFELE